jgi:SOS response regulatory protein OraA/RecX
LLQKRIASRGADRDKLYRFIASRGYSSYVIMRAFEELNRQGAKHEK